MVRTTFLRQTVLFLALASGFAFPTQTLALSPQNPTTLCERFAEGKERTACEKKMKDLAPDWYMASLCSKQFEDKAFYECMDLSLSVFSSPKKLEACDTDELNDQSRIACIKGTKTTAQVQEVFQTREIPKKRVAPKGSQRLSEGY